MYARTHTKLVEAWLGDQGRGLFFLSSRVSYYFDNYRIVTVIRGQKYDVSNLSYFAVYVVRNEYDVGPGDAIAANSKNLTFTNIFENPNSQETVLE